VGIHASPSQRAKADAERRKARSARRLQQSSPGPGAYDAKLPPTPGLELAGSSAFKSKTEGTSQWAFLGGVDAGKYDPFTRATLSARSARTVNKSAAVGDSQIGSRSARNGVRDFKLRKEQGPTPCTYTPKELESPESQSGSSAFASKTKRGAYMGKEVTPGAGEYDNSASPMDRTIPGGHAAFRGSDERFKNLWGSASQLEQAAHLGPGTYSQHVGTIDSARRAQSVQLSSTFASTAVRECKRDWALPAEIEC